MTDTTMKQLSILANRQRDAELEVEKREAALGVAKAALREIAENDLPQLMEDLKVDSFTTRSGLKVEVVENIRASISTGNAFAAFKWLKDNGHGRLIKRVISVVPVDEKSAQKVKKSLAGFDIADKPSVHAQTLAAFVRERLRDGRKVPMELFGVHRQRVSKIK